MRRLIVGIDGGGTKTNLVAVDIKTGSVVSTASSGSIHFSTMKRIFLPESRNFQAVSGKLHFEEVQRLQRAGRGLVFVICRNCRFRPSIMFVVYIIFRISGGYSKKVFKTSQLSSQLLTQEGYCFRQVLLKIRRFSSASSSVTAV